MNGTVWSAAVQALGVILAALFSIYFWRHRVTAEKKIERDWELRRRADRVSDLLVALRAEIMIEVEPLARQFDPKVYKATRDIFVSRLKDDRPTPDKKDVPQAPATAPMFVFDQLKRACKATRGTFVSRPKDDRPVRDKKDMPQAPAAAPMFVFDQLKPELDQLPAEVIEEVVRYYKYDQRLTGLIQAFSAGMYQDLSDERQTEAVDALMELGLKTLKAAFLARKAIEAFLASRYPPRAWSNEDRDLESRLNEDDDGAAHNPSPDPNPS